MPLGDELVRQSHVRAFVQFGGASPVNVRKYAGQDMSYLRIEGVSRSRLGGVEPINIADPYFRGGYKQVGTMIKPPDLDSYSLVLTERQNGIPLAHTEFNCPVTVYESVGQCKNPSDFLGGWTYYVRIYPNGIITKFSDGDRVVFEDDKTLETKMDVTQPRRIYDVGPMAFGQTGGSLTLTATVVNDICYGTQLDCGNCAVPNDGTQFLYACCTGGAAAPPKVLYSVDGGATWTSVSVTAAANAEVLNTIAVVGTRLVAVSKTAGGATQGGYYWADLNPITGVPGAFTKVTTGFPATASTAPNDILVVGSTAYFVGDGGYIYKSTDITAGVTVLSAGGATTSNLLKIDGNADLLVTTGAASAVLYSNNGGATWSAPVATPTSGAHQINCIGVVNNLIWWAGTNSGTNTGRLYYTVDGGNSWTEKQFSGNGTGTTMKDIVVATPECIFFSHSNATPAARIFSSWDGGLSFTNTSPRISGLPTFTSASRLAVPAAAAPIKAANYLAIAATAANGTDGALFLGAAPYY